MNQISCKICNETDLAKMKSIVFKKTNSRKYYNICILCYSKKMKDSLLATCKNYSTEKIEKAKQKRKETNLKKYGTAFPQKLDSVKLKTKQNNLLKHGVENPWQSTQIKDKIKKTNLERYGVEYVSQSNLIKNKKLNSWFSKKPEERQKIINKTNSTKRSKTDSQKLKTKELRENTNLHKYGVKNIGQLNYSYSKISQELFNSIYLKLPAFLQQKTYYASLNFEFIRKFNESTYLYDFTITSIKKIIEFNGDLWHANPLKYPDPNLKMKRLNGITCKEIWDRDLKKIQHVESIGYSVKVIWENDYVKNKEETITSCISWLLN